MIRTAPMFLLLALFAITGCRSGLYYNTLETFGIHKRDMLVERVEEARDDQEAAKEQFKTALERFNEVVTIDGGELERTYNELSRAYDRSETQAQRVRDRIKSIEAVAEDLFEEWELELDQYNSADLRRSSQRTLDQTRVQYQQMITAMKSASAKMDPVLLAFNDQVLYLKHNLNARAIASLEGASAELRTEVAALIADMEKSINQANAFIEQMGSD